VADNKRDTTAYTITYVETIENGTLGLGLYGHRPKSVTTGLGCSLGCTPALSVKQHC